MEPFYTLLALALLGGLILIPILFGQLFASQRELKQRVFSLEREIGRLRKGERDEGQVAPRKTAAPEVVVPSEPQSAPPEASAPPVPEVVAPALPPNLPKSPKPALATPERQVTVAKREYRSEEPVVLSWLDKVGLKPPAASEEGSNAMSWWSTRIGLALGVIAAVFLGMYVNQDTVPWVRLLQLVAVALGIFAGGNFLERKVPPFGRALSAGGLGLLFVAAFAAYGLPAMKVISSPMTGTLVQALVLVLIAVWSLWRNREAVFGLALVLGYLTCWFSVREGLDSVSLIALILLSVVGSLLFAGKGWWSGLWAAVIGSGGGLAVQAMATWNAEWGPGYGVVLAMALSLTFCPLVALSRQWLQGEKRIRGVVPIVTGFGLATSVVAVAMRGFDFEPFYLSFAALLLVAGWWWRRDQREGIWQTLWIKAMILIALYLIARFEGPARSFSLLAQAGALLWMGRSRNRPAFELAAGVAFVVGALLLVGDLNPRPLARLLGQEWALLSYLFCGELLLFGYRRAVISGSNSVRGVIAVFCATVMTIAFLGIALWQVEVATGPLLAWVFGALVLVLNVREPRLYRIGSPFLILLVTLAWLVARNSTENFSLTVWVAAWLPLAWGYYIWLGRESAKLASRAATAVLWASLIAVAAVTRDWLGADWVSPIFLAIALGWAALGSRFQMKGLALSSILPASVGSLIMLMTLSSNRNQMSDEVVSLLNVVLVWCWWGVSSRNREVFQESTQLKSLTTFVGGIVLWSSLQYWLSGDFLTGAHIVVSSLALVAWRFLRASSLLGLAAVFALSAGVRVLDATMASGVPVWTVLIVAILAAGNGVWVSRPGMGLGLLARPKVASVFWGGLAMVTFVGGFGLGGTANWTTAAWATGAVALLVCGFWAGLRGYRIVALAALCITIGRLFTVDIEDTLWRIIAFGVTGALLLGIGLLYNRFHNRPAEGDLDWGRGVLDSHGEEDSRESAAQDGG